ARDTDKELRDGIKEPEAFLILVQTDWLGDILQSFMQHRRDACENARPLSNRLADFHRRRIARIRCYDFGKRAVGRLPLAVVARASHHHRAALGCVIRKFLERTSLADPRLAAEHG